MVRRKKYEKGWLQTERTEHIFHVSPKPLQKIASNHLCLWEGKTTWEITFFLLAQIRTWLEKQYTLSWSINLTAWGTQLEMPHKANKPFWREPPPYLLAEKGRGKGWMTQKDCISFQWRILTSFSFLALEMQLLKRTTKTGMSVHSSF